MKKSVIFNKIVKALEYLYENNTEVFSDFVENTVKDTLRTVRSLPEGRLVVDPPIFRLGNTEKFERELYLGNDSNYHLDIIITWPPSMIKCGESTDPVANRYEITKAIGNLMRKGWRYQSW